MLATLSVDIIMFKKRIKEAYDKDTDQTPRMCRLICIFVRHIYHNTGFLMTQLILANPEEKDFAVLA